MPSAETASVQRKRNLQSPDPQRILHSSANGPALTKSLNNNFLRFCNLSYLHSCRASGGSEWLVYSLPKSLQLDDSWSFFRSHMKQNKSTREFVEIIQRGTVSLLWKESSNRSPEWQRTARHRLGDQSGHLGVKLTCSQASDNISITPTTLEIRSLFLISFLK